jgi:LmbE family N-acetylglucosaminyl deacetylase
VTVLAGDPASPAPPGAWDQACGFSSAGEAARVRRQEDERACRLVGAAPIWLPFGDDQYGRSADEGEVWEMLEQASADAGTLLVPGFPLEHADHAWLTQFVLKRARPPAQVLLYREQPYAAFRGTLSGRSQVSDTIWAAAGPLRDAPIVWQSAFPTPRAWFMKQRAILRYRSQLRALPKQTLFRVAIDEFATGGETVGWLA